MELDRGVLILCVIIGAVILFNVSLIYSLMSGGARQQLDLLSRAARRARSPWQAEDRALDELRAAVDRLETQRRDAEDNGDGASE